VEPLQRSNFKKESYGIRAEEVNDLLLIDGSPDRAIIIATKSINPINNALFPPRPGSQIQERCVYLHISLAFPDGGLLPGNSPPVEEAVRSVSCSISGKGKRGQKTRRAQQELEIALKMLISCKEALFPTYEKLTRGTINKASR